MTIYLVYSFYSKPNQAKKIAKLAIKKKLAACVNINKNINSLLNCTKDDSKVSVLLRYIENASLQSRGEIGDVPAGQSDDYSLKSTHP